MRRVSEKAACSELVCGAKIHRHGLVCVLMLAALAVEEVIGASQEAQAKIT
jgi:hypothetical protein